LSKDWDDEHDRNDRIIWSFALTAVTSGDFFSEGDRASSLMLKGIKMQHHKLHVKNFE